MQAVHEEDIFFEAVKEGNTELVEKLINYGVNVNCQNEYSQTGLHLASGFGFNGVVDVLIKKGIKLNAQNIHGNTAFHMACRWNKASIVRKLMEATIDVNIQNKDGYIGLHTAAYYGHRNIVKIILESQKSDLTITDRRKYTALHMACLWKEFEIAKLLVEYGSDVTAVTIDGETALDLAKEKECIELVYYLEHCHDVAENAAAQKQEIHHWYDFIGDLKKHLHLPK